MRSSPPRRRSRWSFTIPWLFLVAAACWVVWPQAEAVGQANLSVDFQHLVGGLGFGPALSLEGCGFRYDPRLDWSCHGNTGPVAGGACFCDRHAGVEILAATREAGAQLPP